jgi:hypothetical protein
LLPAPTAPATMSLPEPIGNISTMPMHTTGPLTNEIKINNNGKTHF